MLKVEPSVARNFMDVWRLALAELVTFCDAHAMPDIDKTHIRHL
jgi:hypothetical protein